MRLTEQTVFTANIEPFVLFASQKIRRARKKRRNGQRRTIALIQAEYNEPLFAQGALLAATLLSSFSDFLSRDCPTKNDCTTRAGLLRSQ